MITTYPSNSRGHMNHGWLDTRHTFSFGEYHHPERTHFGSLRVINDDIVAPGKGFDTHPHRDMEIITVVLKGTLEHRDSLGTRGTITPGEIQRITAGRGVFHSEFNPSSTEPVHLLQIWIRPHTSGLEPSYDQRAIPSERTRNNLALLTSPDGRDNSIQINQDASLYRAQLSPGTTITHTLAPNRRAFLHLIKGNLTLNNTPLTPGDAAAITSESTLTLTAANESDLLLFDLA